MKVSIISFRASVANATPAAAPLSVELTSMSPALQRVTIFASGAVDFSKCGFRLRNGSQLLLPDIGSNEAGITFLAQEQGWCPLASAPVDLIFAGYPLNGTPNTLTLDFYNTTGAAIVVGGFIHTCMPELTIADLIREMKRYQETVIPVRYDKQIDLSRQSDDPPYPVQQVNKR